VPEYAVGLGDIAVYIPRPRIDMETLVGLRSSVEPSLERKLRRAVASTGQKAFRFPEPWEDTATMAAQSFLQLVGRGRNPAGVRYLAVGTETGVDHSKPVASYVQGMVTGAGVPLRSSLSTYQIQHACAGGTIAMVSIAALLLAGPSADAESGVVICSDIARYERSTTAEITQGAGAVALSLEKNPGLLELDIGTIGYASRDVDDFFRPLGSVTARVKGGYSVQCYNEAFEIAFLDHCRLRGEEPARVLAETDILVVHVPFYQMAIMATHRLLTAHRDSAGETATEYLTRRGFFCGIEPLAVVGNIYTGSVYLALASQLAERYRALGNSVVGKRVLLASYGSGNTMIVLSGRVASRAPEVISRWNLEAITESARSASIGEYEEWLAGPYDRTEYDKLLASRTVAPGDFYLSGIREDGYREYRQA